MNRLERGLRSALERPRIRNETAFGSVTTLPGAAPAAAAYTATATAAMKLSAVDRCVEVLSDSIGKLPIYVYRRDTREHVEHPILELLSFRPNEAQTPTDFKKYLEVSRLCGGNGYAWVLRDPGSLRPKELLPLPYELVTPWLDPAGRVHYTAVHPFTGDPIILDREDVIHVMGFSRDSWRGISVLERASEVIGAARSAQQYNANYYANGGQPAGVLQTEADLSGDVEITLPDGSTTSISKKDLLRREWEKRHAGPTNAQRVAILDYGLKYTPIAISNRDAQFVEQSELSVQDIARFFGVPLYKLQAGKQSYSSNEQNAIEYVVGTLHPTVSRYEEAYTYRLLAPSEAQNLEIRINMMAELRGDYASRATWYRTMKDVGAYSPNDIRELEDLPDVEGGDEYAASLNYVPLSAWRELSIKRNSNGGTNESNT